MTTQKYSKKQKSYANNNNKQYKHFQTLNEYWMFATNTTSKI